MDHDKKKHERKGPPISVGGRLARSAILSTHGPERHSGRRGGNQAIWHVSIRHVFWRVRGAFMDKVLAWLMAARAG
jgi:hypothetical protein